MVFYKYQLVSLKSKDCILFTIFPQSLACVLVKLCYCVMTLGKEGSHTKESERCTCETMNTTECTKMGKTMFLLIFFCLGFQTLASFLSVWSCTKYLPKLRLPFCSFYKCARCHSNMETSVNKVCPCSNGATFNLMGNNSLIL